MDWYKITYKQSEGRGGGIGYKYAPSHESALLSTEGYPYGVEIEEVAPSKVPAFLRVMKEASTEQLRDELQARGWNVQLT